MKRTMIVSSFNDIAPMLEGGTTDEFRFKSLYIVTPSTRNGSDDWQMDTVSKVWMAREPSEKVGSIRVFETRAGKTYACTQSNTPTQELILQTLQFDLSGKVS